MIPAPCGLLPHPVQRTQDVCAASLTITDLAYADDFCLVSSTPDGLQRLIDAADLWCQAVGMQPSPNKTQVMEMTGKPAADFQWSCAGQAVQQVQEVRYLGIIFASGQGFLPSLQRMAGRMWAAWAQLWKQYGSLQIESGVWLTLQLYSACVVPAGSFACEVWGVWPLAGRHRQLREKLTKVHLQQLRQLAGIRKTVATDILLEELQQQPLRHVWLLHAAGFWNSLVGGSGFYRALLQDAVQLARRDGVRNWVKGLLDALEHAGYHPQLVNEELQVIDVAQLAMALGRQRQAIWDAVDICPRATRSEGARLCTYARWFRRPAWRASSVLQLPLTQGSMQRLLRFQTGCHGLPRDVGGHRGVPRHQRICPLCAGGLGDEMHLVFECAALQDLRVSFAALFQRATTTKQFMWQPDLMRVAQFIDAGVRRMREIDPSNGSDM